VQEFVFAVKTCRRRGELCDGSVTEIEIRGYLSRFEQGSDLFIVYLQLLAYQNGIRFTANKAPNPIQSIKRGRMLTQ